MAISALRAEWPGMGTMTFSEVTLRIEETWKGTPGATEVTLRVPGGTDPATGVTLHVSTSPTFRVGERALVFIKEYHGHPWVYGWSQGKYEVVVARVVGRAGTAITEDILLHPLRKRVAARLEQQAAEDAEKQREERGNR